MMYIMAFDNDQGNEYKRSWHVGEKPNLEWEESDYLHLDFMVQADGDELAYIYNNFSWLPRVNKNVVVWRGEFARFIVENLK